MSAENQSPPVPQPQEPDQAALMNTIRIMKQAEQRANLVPHATKH